VISETICSALSILFWPKCNFASISLDFSVSSGVSENNLLAFSNASSASLACCLPLALTSPFDAADKQLAKDR